MKLAVALLLAAASSARADYSPFDCGKFAELGFSNVAFDRYTEFYRPTSTYTLAPAGTFQGPDAIAEYVKFATPFSPFLDEFQFTYFEENVDLTRFDSETGTCAFTQATQLDFTISAPAFAGLEGEVALYTLLKYEIDGNYVSHVEVYFAPGWYDFFFGSALNTDGVRKYVCEVMRDSCSTTWAANGYDSTGLATCVDDLESLSISDPPPSARPRTAPWAWCARPLAAAAWTPTTRAASRRRRPCPSRTGSRRSWPALRCRRSPRSLSRRLRFGAAKTGVCVDLRT